MASHIPASAELISKARIRRRIKELGRQISKDYKGKELILVGVLKGAFIFMADLLREIKIPVKIDFVQVSSYGASSISSGVIKVKKDIDLPIAGKDILIIEDIIDCGYTLAYLLKFMQKKKVRSARVCVLLDKPGRRKADVPVAYRGFTVPDKFIVGYGLDCAEKMRNLPSIRSIR